MQKFFQGWKRKTGCVTLGLACVLTAAWINSFEADRLVTYSQQAFISVKGGLIWERPAQPSSQQSSGFVYLSRSLKKYPFLAEAYEDSTPDNRYRKWAGFVAGEIEIAVTKPDGTVVLERNKFCRAPYWSIVLPLTLLSAYLLLSRTHAQNRQTEKIEISQDL